MLLQYGDVSSLQGAPWFMLELRSEKTIEPTLRRLGKSVPGIFQSDPVEFFVPVFKRDLDIFELKTSNLIFVRSKNFQAMLRLKTVTGIVCIITEGESNRPNKAIPVQDDYVQAVIKEAETEFQDRGKGIGVGSFVRILNGPTRDYCGHVEISNDGVACVRVDLKTKSLLVETPIRNLLNLSQVPPNQRVFYYCDLVAELAKDGLLHLITEDLKLDETTPAIENVTEGDGVEEPRRHSRQRTVTALVKRMILIEKKYDPMEIANAVVLALKKRDIKAPKNLFIVYCTPGDTMIQGPVPFAAAEQQTRVLDHEGNFSDITAHIERPYVGPLKRITFLGNLPLEITPEHEILVLRTNRKYLVKGKRYPLRPHWDKQGGGWKRVWVPASEVLETDFVLCPENLPGTTARPEFIISQHPNAKTVVSEIRPDEDLAWLFGLYIADGGISRVSTGEKLPNGFSICLNKRTSRVRITRALAKLGMDVTFEEYPTYGNAHVNSVSLGRTFLRWFGADCYSKHIPEFMYNWGQKYLQSLVEGIAEGDGTDCSDSTPGATQVYTTSRVLAYQLWHILVTLRAHPCLSLVPREEGETVTIKGITSKVAPAWYVWWTDKNRRARHHTFYYEGYYCMPVRSLEDFPFEGTVYNKSVSPSETYVAGGICCHNCIIKDNLLKNHFKLLDSKLTNYREVVHKFGKQFKFSHTEIAKLDPNLGIPLVTLEICKDGRSREARQRNKLKSVRPASVPKVVTHAPPALKVLLKRKA